jgi:hypothetical protein
MKILILGLPRSGTSSLYDFLRKSLPAKYQCKYEPFKTAHISQFNSNCLIKSVLTNEILLKENQTLLEHTIELVSNFDFVIFLKRDLFDIKVSFENMVNLNKKLFKNEIECSNELIEEWYSVFNKVIEGKHVYEYEKIYTHEISESLVSICQKVNIITDEKRFNQYIHPKNKNNIKLIKSIL